ncbi:MAG: hypothetical protein AAFQ68_24870, partial [Bacteroidota bacterium]
SFLLLLGWAWHLWRWGVPLSLWFDVTEPARLAMWQKAWSFGLAGAAVASLGSQEFASKNWFLGLMSFASASLLLIFVLKLVEKDYQWGNLIEHSIQWTMPLVLVFAHRFDIGQQAQWVLRILIAATFFGHGLYAIAYYPVPGSYLEMVESILGLGPAFGERFLWWAGLLDLITVVGLLLPRVWRYVLYYAIVWGFLTALARIVAHWEWTLWLGSLDQWLHQTLIRLGHGGIPLFLYLVDRTKKR